MILNSKQLDELAKIKIDLLDMIFELNNKKSFIDYGRKDKHSRTFKTLSKWNGIGLYLCG